LLFFAFVAGFGKGAAAEAGEGPVVDLLDGCGKFWWDGGGEGRVASCG
jgi:hypothetical protein